MNTINDIVRFKFEYFKYRSSWSRVWFCTLTAVIVWFGGQTPDAKATSTPIVVPTMAALRALDVSSPSITNGAVVYMASYGSSSLWSDRGGGYFMWLYPTNFYGSRADDGGRFVHPNTIVSTNIGYWTRLLNGESANVKMWGAVGDAVTDDTAAITNAIAACDTLWCSELVFPSTDVYGYLVKTTIVFNANLHLRGENPATTTILAPTNATFDILRTRSADISIKTGSTLVNYDHGLLVENLKIYYAHAGSGGTAVRNTTNACLTVSNPGESAAIRNIQTDCGGFGIRVLGSGAPGLRLRDVSLMDAAIAGLSIEPPGTNTYDDGNGVNILGISGDITDYPAYYTQASLIRFTNCAPGGYISGIKAEGDFGGGVIQFTYAPYSDGFLGGDYGQLEIHNANVNAGALTGYTFYPCDFIKLLPGQSIRTPSLLINNCSLNGVANAINDLTTGRTVPPGPNFVFGKIPVQYEATTNYNSRLVVGQTAYATLMPTQTNWYRIMQPLGAGPVKCGGRLTIKGFGTDDTAVEINLDPQTVGTADPFVNVVRSSEARSGWGYGPIVSQLRAFDCDIGGTPMAAVDVYIGVTNYQNYPIRFSLDIDGNEDPYGGEVELMGNVQVAPAYPPAGATSLHSIITNLYR